MRLPLLLSGLLPISLLASCVLPGYAEPPAPATDAPLLGTALLQQPTVSADHVVFRYADDLWATGRDGGVARRLTSSAGIESSPKLSPDGRHVAFTGSYEGNPDVYVMPVEGGLPQRLTWHPGGDTVLDWLPDGSGVVFRSNRNADAPVARAFVASLEGGTPTPLELPKVNHLAVDAGAERFAYTSTRDAFGSWKRYRGGRLANVWIFDRETRAVEVVPTAGANDSFPAWLDGTVYFGSDRDGVMNLYAFTPGDAAPRQLTSYTDFHLRSLDAGGGVVVFERASGLGLYDPATGEVEDLVIEVRSDGLFAAPRWQDVSGHVRSGSLAPNGKRAVFEARGEVLSLPKESGPARNLTGSPGAHDRSPVWSPDGAHIAWFSDASGEYLLHVADHLGRDEPRAFELGGAGFYFDPRWSPDSAHLMFTDKANRLAYLTLETGEVTEVARANGSLGNIRVGATWSPDAAWIAYEDRNPRTLYDRISLYALATGGHTPVSDAFAHASDPAFSRDGEHLFFFASVNRGAHMMGLNMSTSAHRDWDGSLYVAVLSADGADPFAEETDEGFVAEDEASEDGDDEPSDEDAEETEEADASDDAPAEEEPAGPSIDLEGLHQRILGLPLGAGKYAGLATTDGHLLYLERDGWGPAELKAFSLEDREASTLTSGVRSFSVSADGKSLLLSEGSGWRITDTKAKSGERLDVDGQRVRVDPSLEWPQTLREVWRIQRDFFYDPQMHGVDWDAMWQRWQAFLPHVRSRSDLNLVIAELIGELACGHQYVRGGESPDGPGGIGVGLLGADFDVDQGRYRIARIHPGQNWNASQRSPLTTPGVEAREGDYLLAVDGVELTADDNLYAAFVDRAGERVELTLAADPAGTEPRTTVVEALSSERRLRFDSWVERNRQRVDEASGGRLAYIYMPNTGRGGMNSFDRDFYSQLDRQGLILDERYNGGGQVADYVIELLERDVMSLWRNREDWVGVSPSAIFEGPKVMVINESAGSGGDWMPWAFQRRGLGPLVGTRTWGGLVGISGYPPLMDGGSVTAASFGVMDPEGNWIVENVGVAPDHEVIEWPAAVLAGEDPQLDKAIALALEALEGHEPRPLPEYVPPAPR